MANTTRQNILDFINTTLGALSGIAHSEINRLNAVDVETQPLPSVFIYSGPERKLNSGPYAVIGYENWEWQIILEVWAQNEALETLLGTLHNALSADRTLGGYAATSERSGVDILVVDITREIKSMLIPWTVIYRHAQGTM